MGIKIIIPNLRVPLLCFVLLMGCRDSFFFLLTGNLNVVSEVLFVLQFHANELITFLRRFRLR